MMDFRKDRDLLAVASKPGLVVVVGVVDGSTLSLAEREMKLTKGISQTQNTIKGCQRVVLHQELG